MTSSDSSSLSHPAMAQRLDGKHVADQIMLDLTQQMHELKEKAQLKESNPILPKLVVLLVGENPASQVYVNKKAKMAQKIGMLSEVLLYPANSTQAEIMTAIKQLNDDPAVHGILVQLPLPRHIESLTVLDAISPDKDVDGLHPLNIGRLLTGEDIPAKPCTPSGIITLLKAYKIPFKGRHAVILGRSNIVGKPMALLLLGEDATVTICHSKTNDLESITRQADILVAAVGIPTLVKASWIKPGAVVVDVGINRVNERLVGDVDFDSVSPKASFITPVPGGVGPMTIITLMSNTLALYRHQRHMPA